MLSRLIVALGALSAPSCSKAQPCPCRCRSASDSTARGRPVVSDGDTHLTRKNTIARPRHLHSAAGHGWDDQLTRSPVLVKIFAPSLVVMVVMECLVVRAGDSLMNRPSTAVRPADACRAPRERRWHPNGKAWMTPVDPGIGRRTSWVPSALTIRVRHRYVIARRPLLGDWTFAPGIDRYHRLIERPLRTPRISRAAETVRRTAAARCPMPRFRSSLSPGGEWHRAPTRSPPAPRVARTTVRNLTSLKTPSVSCSIADAIPSSSSITKSCSISAAMLSSSCGSIPATNGAWRSAAPRHLKVPSRGLKCLTRRTELAVDDLGISLDPLPSSEEERADNDVPKRARREPRAEWIAEERGIAQGFIRSGRNPLRAPPSALPRSSGIFSARFGATTSIDLAWTLESSYRSL